MRKTASLLAATLAVFSFCSPAHALINRAWVSGHGADAAGCGAPAAPCRTFQYVHDNIVAPGGEIDVLDPAGYGAITISKALSIVNDGVGAAGVQTSTGAAITINAGPSDAVHLRGLNIDGLGAGANGIVFNSGASLTIVNCVVRHFAGFGSTGNGVLIQPSTGPVSFVISDSIFADNAYTGIYATPSGGTLHGTVTRVAATTNHHGMQAVSAGAPVTVFANQVNASENSNVGFVTSGAASNLYLTRSMAANNAIGVSILGGTAFTYSDNAINNNSSNDVSGGSLSAVNLK